MKREYLYSTVSVVVDGALDAEEDFSNEQDARSYIEQQKRSAKDSTGFPSMYGLGVSIYELVHDHDATDDGDCLCVQYATDHRPIWTNEDAG